MQKVETNLSVNVFLVFDHFWSLSIIFWSVYVVVPSLGVHKFNV